MLIKNYQILFFLIMISLLSCDYQYKKRIGENYFIRCIENRENMNIGFGTNTGSEGIVKRTVYEVYWNENFIIAKRHPTKMSNNSIDRKVTEFIILEKVRLGEGNPLQNAYKTFEEQKYLEKVRNLGIVAEKMESITFDDLK